MFWISTFKQITIEAIMFWGFCEKWENFLSCKTDKIELVCVAWVLGWSEPHKANIRFEISTFEIEHRQNVARLKS